MQRLHELEVHVFPDFVREALVQTQPLPGVRMGWLAAGTESAEAPLIRAVREGVGQMHDGHRQAHG